MRPWSNMFGLSLMLTLGTAVTLGIASILLVMLSPAPFDFPISTFEVARVLKGEKIVLDGVPMSVQVVRDQPVANLPELSDPLTSSLHAAILRQLQVPAADLNFRFVEGQSWFGSVNYAQQKYERQILESSSSAKRDRTRHESTKLYQHEQSFSMLIFRAFRASARQPDGSWRVLVMDAPGPRWQVGLAKWILLMLLLMVPIAWIFSRRLARPIRAFAQAAERIGHGHFEQVQVQGTEEIRMAAAALNDMQARLQQLMRERTTMIAAIAHDLRTPLARLSFLLADAPGTVRDRAQAQLSELDQMIAGTLDFVRHETMQLKRERMDLRALLESILDDHVDLGDDVLLVAGDAVMLSGDPQVLRRLFANLIDNALKYGSQARVSLQLDAGQALVFVVDRGPGISEIDRERVFEPFYRSEPSRNRNTGGAGLGLAIVRSAVRAHGGEITLSNTKAGGLMVQVRLPL